MTSMEQDHEQSPSPSPQEQEDIHTGQVEEPETEDMQGQEHTQGYHQPTTESSPPAEDAHDVELESVEHDVQQLDLQDPEQNTGEGPTVAPSSPQQPASSDMLAPPSNTFANSSRQSSPNANAFTKRNSIASSETGATAAAAVKEPTIELTPRLVIEKMVLVNFKSYAGRQEIGPFHKSFTSVVGPNGSGKSNVIDALLFVFGYRANKMRQGKLSELIHNSKGAEDLESCTVEIHFCEILDLPGPNEFERIEGSGLIVSRQAYRNNSSKYFINRLSSSYLQVTGLLKGRGIDLEHKRFLILQGEVESISQMKPKAITEHDDGLLEYLEDIIGTSQYKENIEKRGVELEALNDERSERLTRVKYVEKERDALEARKREAEDYIKDQNNLAMKQSALYQIYLWEANKRFAKDTKQVAHLEAKLEEDHNKHKGLKDEIEKLENDHNSRVKEYEKIDKETSEILKQLSKIDREDVQMQENRKHLKNKQKKATKSLTADKHSLSENQSWIRNHESDLVKQQTELEKLEKSLEAAEEELEVIRESLRGKTEEFSQQIEEHQKELAPWTAKIVAKQSEVDMAQSEHDLLEQRQRNAQTQYREAVSALETLKRSQASKEDEIRELQESIGASADQIAGMERTIKEMAEKETILKDKANAARARAEEGRASQQSNQTRSALLNNLMRQRDLGKIIGIQGRLGNLGAIDDKYDVAISTACPALDNIVVDNVEVGQQCIEFVRKNNLGRVSLILLNQLPKRNLGPIQTPENVPRLFDLVRPADPKFAPAFYSVMQDTLVATNMDQANRIAYGKQRWRVVTLDGQVIDKSGTMTGGGTRVNRGAMSSTLSTGEFTAEQIAQMEAERDQKETEYRFHQQQKVSLERELQSTIANGPKMEMRLSMFKMDVQANQKRIAESEKRIEALRNEAEPKPTEVAKMKALSNKAKELKDEVVAIKQNAKSIESKIKDLQNKILDAGGVKLRAQKSKADGLKEQIEALGDKATKTKVAKNKAEKDTVKLGTQIAKHEKELAEVSVDLEALEQQIKEKTQEAVGIRKRAEDAKLIMEEKKEEMEELKLELDAKLKVINRIRTAEVEMRNQLDDLKQSLAEHERRLKHWRDLLKELTIQEVDYDEDEIVAELHEIADTDLAMIEKQDVELQIQQLEHKLSEAKPNLTVLEEYKKREEEYLSRAKDLEEITIRREEAKKDYDDLRKKRLDEFMAGFQIISMRLKEMYQMITLGGNAELELVDSLDPFSEGIIFSVMPPKKSWKNISNLSGGEKTLSSLALVFALHHFKPTPLYVMDEIDAALDFRNVSIVANYIKDRTKNAQFVIISLRNNMFELADRLVGIYKTDNKTKSISINPTAMSIVRPTPVPAPMSSNSGANGGGGQHMRRVSTMSRHGSDMTGMAGLGGGSGASAPRRPVAAPAPASAPSPTPASVSASQ
ncbi:MAG: putative nuclear condensin complex subunit Smc4 [Linnemannia elongata]|nr:MAG: putative nuclear condensin complex subunit Smc4 [Linnemannia elongata]